MENETRPVRGEDMPVPREDIKVPNMDEKAEPALPKIAAKRKVARSGLTSGTGIYSGFILLVLITVALVILAAQNTESVTLEFLGLDLTTPLIALLLSAVLLGVLIDEVVGWVWRRRRRRLRADRAELESHRAVAAELEAASKDDVSPLT